MSSFDSGEFFRFFCVCVDTSSLETRALRRWFHQCCLPGSFHLPQPPLASFISWFSSKSCTYQCHHHFPRHPAHKKCTAFSYSSARVSSSSPLISFLPPQPHPAPSHLQQPCYPASYSTRSAAPQQLRSCVGDAGGLLMWSRRAQYLLLDILTQLCCARNSYPCFDKKYLIY